MSLHRRSWTIVLSAVVVLGELGCSGEPPGELGKATQNTWDGDDSEVDTSNKYNAVARLSVGCSGVLVSPFWILTASHCFSSTTASVTATFNYDSAASGAATRQHTSAVSGPVLLRISNPNAADLNHVAQDFALFRLNTRVSSAIARPIHVPLQADVCPGGWGGAGTGFTGTAIGFGSAFPNDSPCGPISALRRYSKHDGYFRFGQVDGSMYNKTYANSLALCSEYSGTVKGDSGGAFIDTSGHLCGVISGMIPPIYVFPDFMFLTSNHMAGVDSAETIDWLSSAQSNGRAFIDAEGNFDGECPAYLATCTAEGCDDTNSDADELVDACDVCPHHSDNAADGDGDGIPDCLDFCPADARQSDAPSCDEDGDFDCDGVCDGADICPFRPDSPQKNANSQVETRWSAGVMGDACEPVPVPNARAAAGTVMAGFEADNSFFGESHQLVVQDEIKVRTQRSRRARPLKTGPVSAIATNVPTHFRFCQEATGTELPCDDSALVNATQLHLEVADAASESHAFRYHRVTMEFSATRGATRVLNYDDGNHQWRWSYAADAVFWGKTGIVTVPGPEWDMFVDSGPASGLGGRFWVHAQTVAGTVGNDVGTGTHGPASLGGTEQLASRYFDLDPEFVSTQLWSHPVQDWRPLFIWQTLVDPPPYERYGVVAAANPGDAEMVVALEGGDFGLANFDGTAQPLQARLSDGLRRSLVDASLVWASGAEVSAMSGKAPSPAAIAITADGHSIADQAWIGPNGAAGTVEPQQGASAKGARVASVESLRSGVERRGFVPVYSRSLATVFLVGGQNAAGLPAGDISTALVSGGAWAELTPPAPLGRVLAATYSYKNHSLYVIDETTTARGEQSFRFVRVDARRGGGEVVATWAPSNVEKAWLGTDADGNVLLSLTSERLGRHSLVRYEVDSRIAFRVLAGQGALVGPALVADEGLIVYTRARGRAGGQRFGALVGARIGLSEAWSLG